MVLFWSCLHYTQGCSDVLSGTNLSLENTYDHSFQNSLGKIIRIEVKGTKNLTMTNFDLTRNELNAAKKFQGSYKVWMVTDVPRNPEIHELDDPYGKWEDGDIGIEPTACEVRRLWAE